MKNLTVVLSLAVLAFASCSQNSDKSYIPAGSGASEKAAPAGDAVITTPTQESTPAMGAAPMDVQPQTITSSASATTASGMNPPHGEPGHRCDIAVGAPLSSAPTQPSTINTTPGSSQMTIDPSKSIQQGTTQIPVEAITPSTAPAGEKTVTPPGMNPPHGEPGHDCAVAVGAPLPQK